MGLDLVAVEALRPRIVAYLWPIWGSDSEDIVADACIKVALMIEAGEVVTSFYLWQAARFRALDFGRRRAARHESPGVLPETLPAPASLDVPPEGFEESTEAALGKLTDRQIEAATLQADGYSGEEIGARLGCSAQAVRAILHRARSMVKAEPGDSPAPPPATLSPRELEVIAALADGLDYAGIGRRLGISSDTVKNHLASAYAKLGAANAAQCVAMAIRRGLVQ